MILRLDDGYYVRFNGVLSEVRSTTRSKAEAHLEKLQRGLVALRPFKGSQDHNPKRTLPYQGIAGNRGRALYPN